MRIKQLGHTQIWLHWHKYVGSLLSAVPYWINRMLNGSASGQRIINSLHNTTQRKEPIQKNIPLSTMRWRCRASRWAISRIAHHLTVGAVVQRCVITLRQWRVVFWTMFIVWTRRLRRWCSPAAGRLLTIRHHWPIFSVPSPWRRPRIWPVRRHGLDVCLWSLFSVKFCCTAASQLHTSSICARSNSSPNAHTYL